MVKVEITNLTEFKKELEEYLEKRMWVFGQLLVTEIQNQIQNMGLFRTGDYWRGIHAYVDEEGSLIIEDSVFYGIYLEYGTYSYWDIFGLQSFTDPLHPKKMSIPKELKQVFPKGMQPFAPFRRVLWNDKIMRKRLAEALS